MLALSDKGDLYSWGVVNMYVIHENINRRVH